MESSLHGGGDNRGSRLVYSRDFFGGMKRRDRFGIGDCASGELVSESPLGVCPMLMIFLAYE